MVDLIQNYLTRKSSAVSIILQRLLGKPGARLINAPIVPGGRLV
jgi:hypothetical protein